MEMRRKELAVTEEKAVDEIIQGCICFRLALPDGDYPYVVPLNFGYAREEGVPTFYFHSGPKGHKVTLCREKGRGGFELDRGLTLKPNDKACDFSMAYQSVVGRGPILEITDPEEKTRALQVIMGHYSDRQDWTFPEKMLEKTCVFRLTAEEMTARQHG